MNFCPECNFMLYTKLKDISEDGQTPQHQLFNYCKNCGYENTVESLNKSVYKRNYENDYIADKIISNKYTIYDSALPRLNIDCVHSNCITNTADVKFAKMVFIKDIPEHLSNEDLDTRLKKLLDIEKIEEIKRIQLTIVGIVPKDISKTDFMNHIDTQIASLPQDDDLHDIELDRNFSKPNKEVLYIKYDPENMKYLYMCVNCGASWQGNN